MVSKIFPLQCNFELIWIGILSVNLFLNNMLTFLFECIEWAKAHRVITLLIKLEILCLQLEKYWINF